MKKKLVLLALAGCAALPAFARPDVGVSIGINEPGVYGRVDIGNDGPPPVVYSQPVIVAPPRFAYEQQPVYIYVPVEQQRHWRAYCGQYGACDRPVYFVREQWVRDRWEHEHHERWRDHDRRDHERRDRDDRHDHDHGDWHDRGR